jgi:hypothetical protein
MASSDPLIQQALADPANIGFVKGVLGLSDLVVPGEDSRNKQLREIEFLLGGAPITRQEAGGREAVKVDPAVARLFRGGDWVPGGQESPGSEDPGYSNAAPINSGVIPSAARNLSAVSADWHEGLEHFHKSCSVFGVKKEAFAVGSGNGSEGSLGGEKQFAFRAGSLAAEDFFDLAPHIFDGIEVW